jgi:hypothetical protein
MQSINEKKSKSLFNVFTKNPKLVRNLTWLSTIIWVVNIIVITFYMNNEQWKILSGLGGKCLDLDENKVSSNGTPVIGYECFNDKDTQNFHIEKSRIMFKNKCLDVKGKGNDGDFLVMRACNDSSSQKWHYKNGQNLIINANGKCIDLLGGANHWGNYQVATLWSCNGEDNQKWYLSKFESKKNIKVKNVTISGMIGRVKASNEVVAEGTGNLNFTGDDNKGGLLVTKDDSSVVDTGEKYLVPAGVVAHDVFN